MPSSRDACETFLAGKNAVALRIERYFVTQASTMSTGCTHLAGSPGNSSASQDFSGVADRFRLGRADLIEHPIARASRAASMS